MAELERIKMKTMKEIKVEMSADDDTFEEKVINQSRKIPVVVDFWAVWCTPCLMLGPILEKFAKKYNGKFILVKVNVDNAKRNSIKYGISAIPSVKMFKNGKVVDEFLGLMPEEGVKQWLDRNLV